MSYLILPSVPLTATNRNRLKTTLRAESEGMCELLHTQKRCYRSVTTRLEESKRQKLCDQLLEALAHPRLALPRADRRVDLPHKAVRLVFSPTNRLSRRTRRSPPRA